ncbi:hypothetical protein FKM82_023442 [Ascaphus truei]
MGGTLRCPLSSGPVDHNLDGILSMTAGGILAAEGLSANAKSIGREQRAETSDSQSREVTSMVPSSENIMEACNLDKTSAPNRLSGQVEETTNRANSSG